MAEASTSTAGTSRNGEQEPADNRTAYDRLTKRELIGIQKYNEGIIREHFAKGVEVSKSIYLQQVLAENQQIEARIAMLEQMPDEREAFLQKLPPLPEYILSVKSRAAQRPVVLHGRNQVMPLEEAAMIERAYAEKQKTRRPPRQQDFGAASEKEKHAIIMNYMNHKESDEEEYDSDEDEYWFEDGQLADGTGPVGGEWVDTNDIAHMIAVDRERITAGGFYDNYVEDS